MFNRRGTLSDRNTKYAIVTREFSISNLFKRQSNYLLKIPGGEIHEATYVNIDRKEESSSTHLEDSEEDDF